MARSMREHGVLEPIVISLDDVSHERASPLRRSASRRTKKVPVRVHPIKSAHPDFLKILIEFNAQRIKSAETLIREAAMKIDPKKAHERLASERMGKLFESIWAAIFKRSSRTTTGDARFCQTRRRRCSTRSFAFSTSRKYWPLDGSADSLSSSGAERPFKARRQARLGLSQRLRELQQRLRRRLQARAHRRATFRGIASPTRRALFNSTRRSAIWASSSIKS